MIETAKSCAIGNDFSSALLPAPPARVCPKENACRYSAVFLRLPSFSMSTLPNSAASNPAASAISRNSSSVFQAADRYRVMFGRTHTFLPHRNGLVPNTAHVFLHVCTLVTLVVLYAL
jgi:hypothetical protein